MKPIKLGIMCPGTWGRNIIDASLNSERVKITVCASRTRETAEKAAHDYGIKAVSGFEELLKQDIQGVVLACPHHLHSGQTLAAAAAGKHVLIEKPISNTVQEAKAMAAACTKAGLVLSVGHSQRRLPGPRTLNRVLADGSYGRPVNAVAYVGLQGVDMYGFQHWLLDGEKNPGGSLYMMGVHFTETFQYLLGPIQKASGFLIEGDFGTTIPEIAGGVFEFEARCLGYLGSHYVAPYNSTASFYFEKAIFHMEKFGRELYIQDSPFPKIERQPFPLDETPYGNPVREELEEFAECIERGKEPETGASEAIAALAGIRGLMISAREKRTVGIEEIMENYQYGGVKCLPRAACIAR